jgi:hypothetical protein
LSICIVAILGGFEALATAFLEDAALVFLVISAVFACVAQPFVWFPHWDILQRYGPPDYEGPPQTRSAAGWLVVKLSIIGALWVVAGLTYTTFNVLLGLWFSTKMHRVRVSVRMTWLLSSLGTIAELDDATTPRFGCL